MLSADSLYNGDTLTVTFVLGDTATPVNNIYGIAFTYNFDPIVVDSSFTRMSIGNSWMGTSTDKISISKIFNVGQIKAALTRIDHANRSGNGPIAAASFKITTDNISGKDLVYYANIGFISDVVATDERGNTIQLNMGADTSEVGYTPNGIKEITEEAIYLAPNPAHDKVTVTANNQITDISVTNVMGQEVLHDSPVASKSVGLNITLFDSGVYVVHLKTNKGAGITKLVVER